MVHWFIGVLFHCLINKYQIINPRGTHAPLHQTLPPPWKQSHILFSVLTVFSTQSLPTDPKTLHFHFSVKIALSQMFWHWSKWFFTIAFLNTHQTCSGTTLTLLSIFNFAAGFEQVIFGSLLTFLRIALWWSFSHFLVIWREFVLFYCIQNIFHEYGIFWFGTLGFETHHFVGPNSQTNVTQHF